MIKKYMLVALVAFSFMGGVAFSSGDPMTGTVTAIDGDNVTITDVCGREYTFYGCEDYDVDDEVAFIHQGSRVLKARYTG